jgi:hypothetical protein
MDSIEFLVKFKIVAQDFIKIKDIIFRNPSTNELYNTRVIYNANGSTFKFDLVNGTFTDDDFYEGVFSIQEFIWLRDKTKNFIEQNPDRYEKQDFTNINIDLGDPINIIDFEGGWKTQEKTNPKLWAKVLQKERRKPGPWAAWKSMEAVREYKRLGGKYKSPRPTRKPSKKLKKSLKVSKSKSIKSKKN